MLYACNFAAPCCFTRVNAHPPPPPPPPPRAATHAMMLMRSRLLPASERARARLSPVYSVMGREAAKAPSP